MDRPEEPPPRDRPPVSRWTHHGIGPFLVGRREFAEGLGLLSRVVREVNGGGRRMGKMWTGDEWVGRWGKQVDRSGQKWMDVGTASR